MTSQKLVQTLDIVTNEFRRRQIPYSLIDALALGIYGSPRFTADINLLTEYTYYDIIFSKLDGKADTTEGFEL